MRFIALLLAFPLLSVATTRTEHVFIISFDGGNPTIMQQAEMPNFKRLAAEGAYTWQARTILPSKTLPSHTAMLTGVDIAKHQIDWNDFFPLRGQVKVPTVFELLKAAQPQAQTALFCGKIKFRHLWKPDTLDIFNCGSTYGPEPIPATEEKKLVPAQQVAAQAVPYIIENKPTLCFIHFPDADSAGHKSGWGSPEQMKAFKVCDQALSQILTAIDQAGIRETSTLILTADHGGSQKNHFQPIPSDITIPWIAWGKAVKKQHSITKDSLFTFDTAATALWLLGVPLPTEFDGEPVLEAFEE
jgi:predicted AlkP superfamily pyrophosphatase or phosphodiesterase